ncbi:Transcriptional activator FeaR [Pseudomonas fluorescens]|uniref:Transcriptional activator FeaR n=1 Tax=Pseudomonas fluorescens TaxID=294 RepID=A0A5E7WKA5_PSEFL|nr:transcriptional regulator FeaR [Pseudomonas fluorescens]VVQ35463.1 Transcriptional activator FeaR [Pseudomonas fluorescens]
MNNVMHTGAQGFEEWNQHLFTSCGTFHAEPPVEQGSVTFAGSILPSPSVNSICPGSRIVSNCHHVHRQQSDIRRDDRDFYYLVMQMNGSGVMCQTDGQTRLKQNDLVLLDVNKPCDFYFTGLSDQLSLIIPRRYIESRFRNRDILLNHRIAADSRLGTLIGMLAQQLFDLGEADAEESEAMLDALLTLMRPSVSESPTLTCAYQHQTQAFMLQKAKVCIEAELTNSTLSPSLVADRVGTSVRNLHRLFANCDTTIGRYILERRLEQCAENLKSDEAYEKVSSVAYNWGFNDVSHFSRSFKAHFGMSPREFRLRKPACS